MPEPRLLFQGKFLRLLASGHWEYAQRTTPHPAVGIVAVTDDQKILLVEQFRIPLNQSVIEIPAGLTGDQPGHESESLEIAARRELLEETGYEAANIKFLTQGPASAGMSDELTRLVLATGLKRVGPAGGDGTENITLHEIPLVQAEAFLAARVAQGAPVDPKVYAALFFADAPRVRQ